MVVFFDYTIFSFLFYSFYKNIIFLFISSVILLFHKTHYKFSIFYYTKNSEINQLSFHYLKVKLGIS